MKWYKIFKIKNQHFCTLVVLYLVNCSSDIQCGVINCKTLKLTWVWFNLSSVQKVCVLIMVLFFITCSDFYLSQGLTHKVCQDFYKYILVNDFLNYLILATIL